MAAEAGSRAVDVPCDLGSEFLRSGERVVVPKALDKFDGNRLAGEILPMIEQIDLDQSLSGPERRPAADVDDRIVRAPFIRGPPGIDAIRGGHPLRGNA